MEVTRTLFIALILIFAVSADEYHPSIEIKGALRRKSFVSVENEWNEAQKILKNQESQSTNKNTAKNLILFIGAGLSIVTSAATRVYMGGEEVQLGYEQFPYFGLSKTYCVDKQVADSASAATALLSGIKTNFGVVGLSANVNTSQCTYGNHDVANSIIKWAQDAGKSTGFVTTARVTDATVAAAYAHSPNKNWENDQAIPTACRNQIKDIADQLVNSEEGKKLNVILGGGRQNFITTATTDDEGTRGYRQDGRNLINEWMTSRSKSGSPKYIWNKSQLDSINTATTDYLLGLFEADHCMYNLDIISQGKQSTEPSLSDMTKTAVNVLKKNTNGYVLIVEAGRIDHANQKNLARRALDETAELSKAVDLAKSMTNSDDTLIVATGDHANVMTISGYSSTHNDILKYSNIIPVAYDRMPFETLTYANGPAYSKTYGPTGRNDITNDNFADINRQYSATVPLASSTNGGEDTGVYSSGPWSHLLTGSFEQNEIPVAMAYAAKIGPFKK
ncbi:hypothetical protein ACKWTF_006461 [Chironomus riparius]